MAITLMTLPYDVRCIIWKLAFPVQWDDSGDRKVICIRHVVNEIVVEDDLGYPNDTHDWNHRLCTGLQSQRNLLLCSRQAFQEIAPFLYSQQIFRFEGFDAADTSHWLDQIGTSNTSSIQHIHLTRAALDETESNNICTSHILKRLPQLRSLKCPAGIKETMPEKNGESYLQCSRIISAVSILVHLQYLYLDAPSHHPDPTEHHLTILQSLAGHLQNLRHLVLKGICNIDRENEAQMKHLFEGLPNLKHLRLDHFLEDCLIHDFWNNFFKYVAPLESLEYHGRFLTKAHVDSLAFQHGTTLRFLKLYIYDRGCEFPTTSTAVRQQTLPILSLLFNNLPVLEILKLNCTQLCPQVLTILPPSLKALNAVVFCDIGQYKGYGLLDLETRCPKLKYLRLDNTLTDRSSDCSSCPAFHEILDYLRRRGRIEIEAVLCIASDCQMRRDDLDFYGISYNSAVYFINDMEFKRMPTPIPGGRPWLKLPSYEEHGGWTSVYRQPRQHPYRWSKWVEERQEFFGS